MKTSLLVCVVFVGLVLLGSYGCGKDSSLIRDSGSSDIIKKPDSSDMTQAEKDVAKIRQKIIELRAGHHPGANGIDNLLAKQKSDGSFQGIDYDDQLIPNWEPRLHFSEYVLPMAKAYANPDSDNYHNNKLAEAIRKALDFWFAKNPICTNNWWQNEIGVPKRLSLVLVLMGDAATDKQLEASYEYMSDSEIKGGGSNRAKRAGIQLLIGVSAFGRDVALPDGPDGQTPKGRLEKASRTLQNLVRLEGETNQGIRADWSFHQHGMQLQFGKYGIMFGELQSMYPYVLAGTPYAYSSEKIRLLRSYLIKGLGRVAWKGTFSISAMGRGIFPGERAGKGSFYGKFLKSKMVKSDPSHAGTYNAISEYMEGKGSFPDVLAGNRYYWRSAFMTDRSRDRFIEVRMSSDEILSTESINGENKKGGYLADGATFIYTTGHNYEGIFPVWDWHRIPGVTSYMSGELPTPGINNGSSFVGGLSDTDEGIAVMIYKKNDLTARKSWFFTDVGVVCLGSGIEAQRGGKVVTTINQSIRNGPVSVNRGNGVESLGKGQHVEGSSIEWAYHNSIGYIPLGSGRVHVGSRSQSGSWDQIYDGGSSASKTKSVFNMWIDHGSGPEGAKYAYLIKPNASLGNMKEYPANQSIRVVTNTPGVQAIADDKAGRYQAVFYNSGELQLSDSLDVSASKPCMLLIKRKQGGGLEMSISAPPSGTKQVEVILANDQHSKQTTVNVSLPRGKYAGQTVHKTVTL